MYLIEYFPSRRRFSGISSLRQAEQITLSWAVAAIKDIRWQRVIMEVSSPRLQDLLFDPRGLRDQSPWALEIHNALLTFEMGCFNLVSMEANTLAKDIATSVTRDHRYQSYVAFKGPAWLEERILQEAISAR